MSDVAGAPVRAAVDLAAEVDAAAHAGADLHEQQVVRGSGDPAVPLADGHDVHVVVHDNRTVVLASHQIADRVTVPPGHDRRRHRYAVTEADRARHPDTDAGEAVVRAVHFELCQDLVHSLQDRLGTGADVGRFAIGGHRLQPPVGDLNIDRGGAEVNSGEPDIGAQLDQRRAPTAP